MMMMITYLCCSAITFTEFIVCVKFGAQIFKQTQMLYVLYWLIFQVRSLQFPFCTGFLQDVKS